MEELHNRNRNKLRYPQRSPGLQRMLDVSISILLLSGGQDGSAVSTLCEGQIQKFPRTISYLDAFPLFKKMSFKWDKTSPHSKRGKIILKMQTVAPKSESTQEQETVSRGGCA